MAVGAVGGGSFLAVCAVGGGSFLAACAVGGGPVTACEGPLSGPVVSAVPCVSSQARISLLQTANMAFAWRGEEVVQSETLV